MTPGTTGLLLLSGGQGRRMGGASMPSAIRLGQLGGHLARVFESVFPGGMAQVLGDPLPDRPDLPVVQDPREGPARALQAWAALPAPVVDRWWVVACDQVRWTPAALEAWVRRAEAADPDATRWVVAQHGAASSLSAGGFDLLRPALSAAAPRSLMALVEALPHLVLPCDGPEWMDVDTPEERQAFEGEGSA